MLMEDRAIDKTLLFLDTLDSNPGRWQFILSSSNIQSNTLLEYAFAVEENVEAYLEFYEVINNITLTNYEVHTPATRTPSTFVVSESVGS